MPPFDALAARYDETPYRDQVFEDADLGRLLGLARLFGLGPDAASAEKLRVLDLACASGCHVRAQAARYPNVDFTGVDFSESEVSAGQQAGADSGASNVRLVLSDLRELDIPAGEFDVILCRGAFSWVPDDVKERIFEVCRTGLRRSGIAVIAYLTYPGWKQREAIRELLHARAQRSEKPRERLRDSALLLRLLRSGYEAHGESPHAKSLAAVVESMQASSANAFLHDELGSIHDPCYFSQFAEWAGEWGLQYLAELDLGSMLLGGLPGEAAGLLQELSPDFLETQQLIDFLVNRSGRTSILVRDDAPVARQLRADALSELVFTTSLQHARVQQPEPEASPEFHTKRGERIRLEDPCARALVRRMLEPGAGAVRLDTLEACGAASATEPGHVASELLGLIARGYVDPRLASF